MNRAPGTRTNLTEHFTLEEFTFSETAARAGLPNRPGADEQFTLLELAQRMEQVRALLGHPIMVTSAFRSVEVNLLVTNGRGGGHHPLGGAVDFKCPGFGAPLAVAEAIAGSTVKFGQLIVEYGRWVHFSILPVPKSINQIITIDALGTRPGLLEARS